MDRFFVVDVSLFCIDQSTQRILWDSFLSSKLHALDDVLPDRRGRCFLDLRIGYLFRRFLTLRDRFKRIGGLLGGGRLRSGLLGRRLGLLLRRRRFGRGSGAGWVALRIAGCRDCLIVDSNRRDRVRSGCANDENCQQ
jgi:hypothetical protein